MPSFHIPFLSLVFEQVTVLFFPSMRCFWLPLLPCPPFCGMSVTKKYWEFVTFLFHSSCQSQRGASLNHCESSIYLLKALGTLFPVFPFCFKVFRLLGICHKTFIASPFSALGYLSRKSFLLSFPVPWVFVTPFFPVHIWLIVHKSLSLWRE